MAERAEWLFPNIAAAVWPRYGGGVVMKRLLLLLVVVGGAIAVVRRLPVEQRQRLADLPTALMGVMMEHVPDN